jgi:Protein of unknown function (DUF3592)
MYGRIGSVAFVLAGFILLAFAAGSVWSTRAFLRDAARAEGTVSELNAGGSHPEIHFVTASGQPIFYPQGGLIFGYQKGDVVTVLYSPADPEATATIDSFGAIWFSALLIGALGFAFLVGGLIRLRSAE